jgi:methylated-DNA-[protein]-cysteine S-methyltransferase
MTLSLHRFDSPLGPLHLAGDAHGRLRALDFSRTRLDRGLAERCGAPACVETGEPHPAAPALARYFAGELDALEAIELDAGGSGLDGDVWAALREIPAGRVVSYGELARRIGRTGPRAAREVGAANARNPIAIVVPCHRVVGKDGSLKGYVWGLPRKRWLLAHERALRDDAAPQLPGL